ncbi:MAG: DNA mismatch repair protein MutS [Sphaerochaetaceae bacterium]|nr:DNA mismatch repair protein MutS [Sphaerochaetaceae bacterium]
MDEQKLTPMMEQYLALKRELQDEILFFRLGDFYEMFLDDAKEVSKLLNLTLTARNGIPMCGIPYHAAKNYIKRLLEEGKKIAISEQTEMPGPDRSIAKREIVQIITPGTVVEDEFLDASANNYILSICVIKDQISCAYCELSSGLFRMVVLPREERFESVRALIEELHPRELLVNEEDYFTHVLFAQMIDASAAMKTRLPPWYFSLSHGFALLREHVATISLKQFGLEKTDLELAAGGALLQYLQETAQTSLAQITQFEKEDRSTHLLIDEATRKNLELVKNLQEGSSARTLFSALNLTCTSAGSRLLQQWINAPLASIEQITERQFHVTWFLEHDSERLRIRSLLSKTRDVARLTSRVAMRRANPQDLVAIQQSIATLFSVMEAFSDYYQELLSKYVDQDSMGRLVSLMETLLLALQEDTQGLFTAGKVIKSGYNEELDRLRVLTTSGNKNLSTYAQKLKEETDIPTIKLGQNKIIGYYLEIPKTHAAKIPEWFNRKQTLVHAERYTTEELIYLESEILASGELAQALEKSLFEKLVELTADHIQPLLHIAHFFATLDCLQSFAQGAQVHQYCKPELVTDDVLVIQDGRHPVVEQFLAKGKFVANGLQMETSVNRFCLITGPNMAGKSTYLRQNALIVLMAHIGSYVPATTARIGLIDKLFCRVGASDNLARGESTFLIEMQEAAFILRTATPRSLAIMDEIGRGTSTQDGMSIAYAVMQKMVELGVKTLFATHYHELTLIDTSAMQLLTLAVAESKKNIVFLRKVQPGRADSSYGLHVAKMAGIPLEVIKRAAIFQKQHFADYAFTDSEQQLDLFTGSVAGEPVFNYDPIIDEIANFSLEESTTLEAMYFLERLKSMLAELQ